MPLFQADEEIEPSGEHIPRHFVTNDRAVIFERPYSLSCDNLVVLMLVKGRRGNDQVWLNFISVFYQLFQDVLTLFVKPTDSNIADEEIGLFNLDALSNL